MKTLLIESSASAGTEAAEVLAAAGHQVVRCHPADQEAFPCTDLNTPGSCPLHDPEVEVVLLARSPDDPVPTVNEAGVACAIRAGVPVAVLGHDDDNPYARWTSPAFGNDPLAACKEAIWTAQEQTDAWMRTEIVKLIDADGTLDADDVTVVVERTADRVHVLVTIPDRLAVTSDRVAVLVHSLSRKAPRGMRVSGSVLDVGVHRRP